MLSKYKPNNVTLGMISDLSLQANNGTLGVKKKKKKRKRKKGLCQRRPNYATLGYHYEVTAGRLYRLTYGPQPTPCPHVRENEAGTITNCNCGLEDQTAEHNYKAEMPASAQSKTKCVANSSPAILHTKLYGSKEELEKTATFILQSGLSV